MTEILRTAEVSRKTSETEIFLHLDLEGTGDYQIDIEIPFLGHMLSLFAMHSLCNLKVWGRGDIPVDDHHTVEDIGICLGQAIKQGLGDKKGIRRYGEAAIPMDESLVSVVMDLSGRPFLHFNVEIPHPQVGGFDTELVEEFFRAVVNNAGITLHIDMIRGKNTHHIVEAIFKAFARAFREAAEAEPGVDVVWSTKGRL